MEEAAVMLRENKKGFKVVKNTDGDNGVAVVMVLRAVMLVVR